jgi:tight adherence protein C
MFDGGLFGPTVGLAAGLALAAGGLWQGAVAPRRRLVRALSAIAGGGAREDGRRAFGERVVRPALDAWAARLAALTPGSVRDALARSLERAGRPGGRADLVLLGRLAAAVAGLGVGVALPVALGLSLRLVPFTGLFGLLLAALVPATALTQAIERRQGAIRRALPDTLDLLVTTVEAGLGFEAALARVIEGRDDPLAQEIRIALTRMRYGHARGDALRELGRRTGNEDLARFAAAVAQADELGTSIAGVLRAQSQLLRRLRLTRSEEAAAKVPVKMLLPMVVFIMPGLFLLILGPAVLRALSMGLFR